MIQGPVESKKSAALLRISLEELDENFDNIIEEAIP